MALLDCRADSTSQPAQFPPNLGLSYRTGLGIVKKVIRAEFHPFQPRPNVRLGKKPDVEDRRREATFKRKGW